MSEYKSIGLKILRKHSFTLIGIILGAIGGYLYWQLVGCASGTCPITSKPMNSTLYGAVMGALFFNIIKDLKTTKS
jgi:hypothetical protein